MLCFDDVVRMVFRFADGEAVGVDMIDCHRGDEHALRRGRKSPEVVSTTGRSCLR